MKERKGYYGTEPNSIAFSEWTIVIGKNVGNWLRRNNISKVLLVFDFKHNNVVFIRDDVWGLYIQYPKNDWADSINVKTMIYFNKPDTNKRSFVLRARILNKDSIIMENAPLKKFILAASKRICVDMDNGLIIAGRFTEKSIVNLNLTEKDLVRGEKVQPVSPTINKQITVTPSMTNSNVTATPSQPESGKSYIDNKGIGDNDLLEMTDENSAPSEEQKIVDKEYSKMILGE